MASATFYACTSDSYIGNEPMKPIEQDTYAIELGSIAKARTRVSHEESAELLNNKFYVYGTKTLAGVTSPIFDNYVVEYATGSAGQTTTNVKDWEYAGKTSLKGAVQGVKYWDFSAERYDFVAAAGLGAGETIKSTSEGMRIKVNDAASMTQIFVADRVTATPTAQAATSTTPATNAYKETVQFQFRRLGAQMRIGFYETVPGYAVKDLIFYYIGAPSGSREAGVGAAFPASGSYTVTYNDATNASATPWTAAS